MQVLDAKVHSRLIADREHACATAGVQRRFLETSMTEYCGEGEIDWVRNFKKYQEAGVPGLLLEGTAKPDTRCQAIAGALMRNFIDARVIPVNTLIELAQEGIVSHPTVLLIPNLYVTAVKTSVPAWRVQVIYDLLLSRTVNGRPTVAYVETLQGLAQTYGAPFYDFLSGFTRVTK